MESGRTACITPDTKIGPTLPVWSAGSDSVMVHMDGGLWIVNIATGTPRLLSLEKNVTFPYDWSPDGRYMIGTPGGGGNSSMLALADGGRVTSLLDTRVAVRGFRFSPDGKWVAYSMNDSGQD